MAEEEFDVEALLEAPYVNGSSKADDSKQSQSQPETSSSSKRRSRSRSHPRQDTSSKRDRDHDRDRDRSDRDRNRDRDRDRDRDRGSARDGGRNDRYRDQRDSGRNDRDRDRERDRGDRDRDRGGRDDRRDSDRRYNDDRRDRDRRHDRDRREDRRRSRSPDRRRDDTDRRRKSSPRHSPSPAVKKPNLPELTPEERDARTVICMQLASRIRPENLEEFFSSVGRVTDVRLVTDRKRKSKGIAYVEFLEVESVSLAIALTGQKLLGVPIVVQLSHAEKNRLAAMQAAAAAAAAQAAGDATGVVGNNVPGAAKLYVGSLHQNITDEMLRAIFEPFGKLLDVSIVRDQKTGVSQGFAFITFRNAEDANTALVQMNGFPLAGRPLKVGRSERSAVFPDIGEIDKIGALVTSPGGINALAAATSAAAGFALDPSALGLGTPTGLGLPAGLGIGAPVGLGGLGLDPATAALMGSAVAGMATQVAPPISTQCLMISNTFDPTQQLQMGWDSKLSDDVIQECARNGAAVTHIAVDCHSPQGNVYVKCDSVAEALLAVNALHGRLFDGRVLAVNYVPTDVYHSLFPGAVNATAASVVRN